MRSCDGMARPLRIDIEGGWYHVTARGTERRSIFPDETYCVHFLELLKRMSERYGECQDVPPRFRHDASLASRAQS